MGFARRPCGVVRWTLLESTDRTRDHTVLGAARVLWGRRACCAHGRERHVTRTSTTIRASALRTHNATRVLVLRPAMSSWADRLDSSEERSSGRLAGGRRGGSPEPRLRERVGARFGGSTPGGPKNVTCDFFL